MNFEKDLKFILLLEEMKKINRQTSIIGGNRRENDAEHSWNVATMAMFLKKYSKVEIDIDRVIKMLLIHDLVEIFAGDTFAFDISKNMDKKDRELKSMEVLKSHLDEDEANLLETLWIEFEKMETSESKYANAMDRLHPLLANIMHENGGTWTEHNVEISQVLARASALKVLDDSIYDYVEKEIEKAVEKGYLRK